ncbi:MAG: gliding motility-associated C-terminal domain-containing protein, partial [Bacteroidota bacterium]
IFDRWGRLIAENRTDIGALWDGMHHASGKPASTGVYYYHILYEELSLGGNIQQDRKGWVTLVR